MAYPERWLSELMARNDIVSVISEYTRLSSRGGRMWGLCPFHPERDPSFSVSPDKQLFHCFSCKAGGSVIQFIEQAENLSYHDAIRFLAQRVGMDMPNEVDDERLRAEKARRDFGITDDDVLDAIRYHTTAKADMTMLEKLVYTADSVSFDRTYEPIPQIREIAMRDFDEGFKAVLKYTYDKVSASGKPMHPLTLDAVKCYLGDYCKIDR